MLPCDDSRVWLAQVEASRSPTFLDGNILAHANLVAEKPAKPFFSNLKPDQAKSHSIALTIFQGQENVWFHVAH